MKYKYVLLIQVISLIVLLGSMLIKEDYYNKYRLSIMAMNMVMILIICIENLDSTTT